MCGGHLIVTLLQRFHRTYSCEKMKISQYLLKLQAFTANDRVGQRVWWPQIPFIFC